MKSTYILMFIFMLSNYLTVHSQEEPKEPLAKLWNIENDEILKYLSIEKNLSIVDNILKSLLDDVNFGGTNINVIKNMIFINTLNFTKAAEIKTSIEIRQYISLLNFIRADNSTAKLSSRFQDIDNLAKSYIPKYCMGYINSEINNIIIASCNETRNETSNTAFINAINDRMYYPIFTYYNCFNRSNNEVSKRKGGDIGKVGDIGNRILAGDGIESDEGTCSAGFLARSHSNIKYIATAGHCYNPGSYYLLPWNSTTSTVLIGEMQNYLVEPIDFGLIYIGNPIIQPVPSVRNTDSERYNELPIEDIISVSSNGAHLCLSGFFSHVRCGYVTALNGFTSDGEVHNNNIIVVNLRYIPGDSGGPIFSYKDLTHVSLNGILRGGLFDFHDNINGIAGVITINSILSVFNFLEVVTVP
ncbi:S1 family peptidase [Gigaspora margarita]|uniref:S1 family peptidase n=1 Tax=Gigaspora margarita TaxID=4874 RepID=A0A8H4AVL5_GIGMA|nr:S1 family peptidase [Gigaspora margarita]